MTQFRDKHGKRLELGEWARLFENDDYRVVGSADVGTFTISTVWLGHRDPFETVIFMGDEALHYQARYDDLASAEHGHAIVVALVTQLWRDGMTCADLNAALGNIATLKRT